MTDRDTEHSDLAPESREIGQHKPDPPATSEALSAAFLDLEAKVLRQLAEQGERQLRAIHAGQTEMLRRYQSEWSGHTAALSTTIEKFTNWAGRAIVDLQELTHRTATRVSEQELQLANAEAQHEKEHALFENRIGALERWRVELETQKLASNPPDADPTPGG